MLGMKLNIVSICVIAFMSIAAPSLAADAAAEQQAMQEYLETLTPSQREQVLGLLQGGVADGRWKEGLMFDGIAPDRPPSSGPVAMLV